MTDQLTTDVLAAVEANLPAATAGALKRYITASEQLAEKLNASDAALTSQRELNAKQAAELLSTKAELAAVKAREAAVEQREIAVKDVEIRLIKAELRTEHHTERANELREILRNMTAGPVWRRTISENNYVPVVSNGYVNNHSETRSRTEEIRSD